MAARKRTYMEVHHALDVNRTAEGVAPAGQGKWLYDNTLRAWVLSYDTLPYVPVETIELTAEIPKPVQNNSRAASGGNALEDYKGGLFRLDRPVRFNRIAIDVTSVTDPAEGRLAIYQHPDGASRTSVPLVDFFDFTAATGRIDVAPDGGQPVVLVRGWFWLYWGQSAGAGSFSARVWDTQSIELMNTLSSLNAGEAPTQFTSNIAASSAPATADPVIGGDVDTNTSDGLLLHRLLTV